MPNTETQIGYNATISLTHTRTQRQTQHLQTHILTQTSTQYTQTQHAGGVSFQRAVNAIT